jgi:hypothetical protein
MRLEMLAPVPAVTAAADGRTLTGTALPYGIPGRTSAGTVTVDAGAVQVPTDLRRVKLFRDHGRTTPVGYTTAAEDTPAALSMTFHAAATPDGDTALLEAAEGIRDCLSVELDDVVIKGGHVTAATLTAVALVPIPAFTGADLAAADTPEGPDMTAPAPTPTPTDPATPRPDPSAPADPDVPPVPAQLYASLNPVGGALTAAPRVPTFAAAVQRIRGALNGANDAGALNAALSDVVPANDAQGFLRDQWLGELWTPVAAQRPYIDSMNKATLTGMRVYGWKWETKPEVGDYAGNKTAIPSNPVSIVPVEGNAYRLAGGWDVDRIFVDLASPGFLEAMFSAAVADYARKSNAKAGEFLAANATVSTAAVSNLVDALAAVAAFLGGNGATPSWIAISSDLWSQYLSLTSAEAPWWLSVGAGSVSIKDPAGSVADLKFFVDPGLAAGTVLAGDKRAATHYEAAGSPLRVQAVNIPNGGIDIGVFGYAGDLLNDARGLVKQAVTAGAAALAAESAPRGRK